MVFEAELMDILVPAISTLLPAIIIILSYELPLIPVVHYSTIFISAKALVQVDVEHVWPVIQIWFVVSVVKSFCAVPSIIEALVKVIDHGLRCVVKELRDDIQVRLDYLH